MPTYEYECTKCGHHFERFQKITDEPLKRCPECRSKVLRLVGTGVGIIFKGSGFYQTDYRSEGYKEAEKKERTSVETKKDESSGKSKAGKESKETKVDKKDKTG